MPTLFYNAIKGTTAGTPGTGAFTPNAASAGFRAWSAVSTGWIGLVRYEDGSAWELTYSYWNGTTLSRSSTQVFASSSGSQLTLTSASTAAAVMDARQVMGHVGTVPWRGWVPVPAVNSFTSIGIPAPTMITPAGVLIATTNYLTEQPRVQSTSPTTANGQASVSTTTAVAVYSTAAGRGGFEFTARFGASQLPVGNRVFIGMTATTFIASTSEPSALTASYAVLGKDSTDTNLQLLTNSNAGSGTKVDTGIALVANGWYEVTIWSEPGGGRICMLLIRLDTGAVYFGSTNTDIPANGALLMPQIIMGLSATTGTAVIMHVGGMIVRGGS